MKCLEYIRFDSNFEGRYSEKKDSYLVLIFENKYDAVFFLELKYYKFSNVSSTSNLHSITKMYLFNFI